ncbi:UNVERIFIED_CONTAM: hypothetical protein Sangu_1318900 [Sesamum angustifolium]|uniref:Uncharacterized protein n=1 Tax=Sesamum angustifolium TaxID=2727405 RepID=A0AAW2NLG0_9LAMI
MGESLGISVMLFVYFIVSFLKYCFEWIFAFADDIMFNKLLREEHRAATTPPNTKSSQGASASGDKRGKRYDATQPGSSSKRPSRVLPRPLMLALLVIFLQFLLLLPFLRIMGEDLLVFLPL